MPAIAASAIILAGFLAALLVNWPGHLSYDFILQLLQGRTALYNTWHPPVMAWLLGLGDAILPGAGLFVIFDALLAFGALFSLLFLKPVRSGWLAAIVVLIAAPLPQLFLYQALVWKDVLFADACVAGFVCLAHAAARWLEHRTRTVLLVAGFVLLALAALTRQNGAVILPFAAAGLGWAAAQSGATRKTAALIGGAFFAGSLVFVFAAGTLLNLRSDGEPSTAEQLHVLQLYDLAGAVAHDPKLVLDPLDDDDPDLAQAIRRDGARLYTPVRNDPLVSAPSMQAPLRTADFDAMRANWMALVLGHPGLYLRDRAEVFAWLVFTPDIAACRPIFTGIEGPLPALRQLGIAPRRDAHDVALERYGKSFFGTPVLSHATFALIALGCLIFLLRRRRPADIVFAALLAAFVRVHREFLRHLDLL